MVLGRPLSLEDIIAYSLVHDAHMISSLVLEWAQLQLWDSLDGPGVRVQEAHGKERVLLSIYNNKGNL